MSTIILSLGDTEATSSEFTIARGEYKNLCMFSNEKYSNNIRCIIQRKNISNNFDNFSIIGINYLFFTSDSKCIQLDIPGIYRVYRPDISEYGVSVGIEME